MHLRLRLIALALGVSVLSACATAPQPPEPIEIPDPDPAIVIVEPEPEPNPVVTEFPPVLPTVALVLSSRNAVYEALAMELRKHFESLSVYDLSDKSQPPVSAFRLINDGDNDAVVAVGQRAARSAVAMSTAPVVFSYVFNHQQDNLLGDRSRGVDAIVPLEDQLNAWMQAEPTLKSVGLLVGPGHTALVDEARRLIAQSGLQFTLIEASSDQEALYRFKRLVRDIDGFWLLPDNRVLSARALKTMIELANRRDVSVLAPNPSMLSIGASISVSPVADDVAARIYDIVEQIHRGLIEQVAPMTPLTRIRVDIRNAGQQGNFVARSAEANQ